MNTATEYENKKVAVELTNSQWNTLTCYILMTTQHRKGEREAWQQLATEKDENGQPKFKNAQSNAEYYESLEQTLTDIQAAVDNRPAHDVNEKMLSKVNDMAAETKAQYDKAGKDDGLYKNLLQQLYGALELLSAVTGNRYTINPDGTINEIKRA